MNQSQQTPLYFNSKAIFSETFIQDVNVFVFVLRPFLFSSREGTTGALSSE